MTTHNNTAYLLACLGAFCAGVVLVGFPLAWVWQHLTAGQLITALFLLAAVALALLMCAAAIAPAMLSSQISREEEKENA